MNEFFSIFRGFYPYFALPALLVIIYRIRQRLWTRSETLLLGMILLHALLLLLQVFLAENKLYVSRRYLLPAAALGFGWTAWGAAELCRRLPQTWRYRLLPPLAAALVIFLLYDGMAPALKHHFGKRKAREREFNAAATAVIRAEWPDLPPDRKIFHPDYYIPKRRPVIASSFDPIGALAGGRDYSPHVAGDGGRVDGWIIAATTPIPKIAVEVRRFEAAGKIWILCRRKDPR